MIYSKSMRDALQEVADYPEEQEQLDESLLGLLRTAAIAVNVTKAHPRAVVAIPRVRA